MTKRINKDGSLNYFEIIKDGTNKEDFIILSIITLFIFSSIVSMFVSNYYNSFEANIVRSLVFLGIAGMYYMVFLRSVFYLYKRDKFEKDLNKISKVSKRAYKNLKKNMYKLENSIFMYK